MNLQCSTDVNRLPGGEFPKGFKIAIPKIGLPDDEQEDQRDAGPLTGGPGRSALFCPPRPYCGLRETSGMLRLVGVVISVGLADSLNPSTVGPAVYLATVGKRASRVAQFTIGLLTVNLVAGLVLTIGPGRLLIGLIPHPQRTARHVIELVAGVILLGCAAALWHGRRSLATRDLPMRSGGGGSALVAGASIAAVELPTAVPYFAVIAAIVASSASVAMEVVLLVLYNIAFVVPLLAIVVVLLVAGESADPWLQKGGAWLQRQWPVVLAVLLLLVGGCLTVLGGTGLVKQ
jgi:cytochrome c biogenesis protein CcdA